MILVLHSLPLGRHTSCTYLYNQVLAFPFTSGTFVVDKDNTDCLAAGLQQTAFPYEIVYKQIPLLV